MRCAITAASGPRDLDEVRALFRDYAASLSIDLGFQGFEAELAGLPGRYAPPAGGLLLARDPDGVALGCVAFRPLALASACEMKRLYVRDGARGTGAGRILALAALAAARQAGYEQILLDTLPSMTGAIRLYERLGFARVPPYGNDVVPGLLCFGRSLKGA